MKLKIFVFILLLSFIKTAWSQERAGDDLRSSLGLYSGDLLNFYNEFSRNKMLDPKDLSGIDGSPYLNTDFENGFVVTKDSIQYAGLALRYNIFNDVIEFERNDVAMELNENFPLLYVVVDDEVFVKASNKEGYFQVVQAGKTYLLKKLKVKYTDAKPASGYQAYKRPAFAELKPDYYIAKELGGEAYELKSTGDFAEILADRNSDLRAFLKKEKIKIDREADLVKVLDYYNSLK